MKSKSTRKAILEALIEFSKPLDDLKPAVAGLPWDSEEELVRLEPSHLVRVLERYVSGKIAESTVEEWANLIESREDISFSAEVKDAIFALANPILNKKLDPGEARALIRRLSAPTPPDRNG